MRIQTLQHDINTVRQQVYQNCEWQTDLNDHLYLDVHALILSQEEHQRIVQAQKQIVRLLHNTLQILQTAPELNDWLGINENLIELAKIELNTLTTYGRFDWVFNTDGELKVLEFNSETPMGWKEAIEYTQKLFAFYGDFVNPNADTAHKLKQSIKNTLTQYNNFGRIAIIGDLADEEENDTFALLKTITESVGVETLICNIDELKIYKNHDGLADGLYVEKNDFLYPIDVLQSFYSIEWLAEDEGGAELLTLLSTNKVKLMNPVSTLQLHSKALWALIWYLKDTVCFDVIDTNTIEQFIPFSTFDLDDMVERGITNFVQKPLHHREGSGIIYKTLGEEVEDDDIFQERISIQQLQYPRENNGIRQTVQTDLTIGVYCINDEFGGYMTRLSQGICSAYDATFVPTFIE